MSAVLADTRSEQRPRLLSLRGRIGRARYVAYTLGAVIGAFLLMLLAGMMLLLSASLGRMLYTVFTVALLYGALPLFFVILTVKRAHDFNAGGWLALLLLVPVVNLLFWFLPGSRGENGYGPRPEPAPFGVKFAAVALPLLLIGGFLAADGDSVLPEAAPDAPPSTTLRPYTP